MRINTELVNLRHLDELARGTTVIHRLNPCAKLVTTLLFILAVTSFSRYDIAGLIPFFLFPVVLINVADIPVKLLVRRIALTLPFILLIGIFNPLLDHSPALQIGSVTISSGWISFLSIIIRSVLAVSAALILIATTGMNGIGTALLKLRVPKLLVVQLLFMYRYLYILIEEVARTLQAYTLRSCRKNGVSYRVVGSLMGQLLLRTIDRAERIYVAMLCRGFDGVIRRVQPDHYRLGDSLYVLGWVAFFVIARTVNIAHWLGSVLLGG